MQLIYIYDSTSIKKKYTYDSSKIKDALTQLGIVFNLISVNKVSTT